MRNFTLQNLTKSALSSPLPQSPRPSSEPFEPQSIASASSEVLATSCIEFDSDSPTQRSPSPTPTEVDDPEPEVILEGLKNLSIKVRDFAYPTANSSSTPKPATEVFDPFKGVAEYEFRLGQKLRTYPIQGKTMRRLFSLGWVCMEEATERLHQIDWDALKDYDSKDKGYPWRPIKFTEIPDAQGRQCLLESRYQQFVFADRMRRNFQAQEERAENDRLIGVAVEARAQLVIKAQEEKAAVDRQIQELLEKGRNTYQPRGDMDAIWIPSISGRKRSLEHTPSTPNLAPHNSTTDGGKRVKLTSVASSSQPPFFLTPPLQQYPAALQSYDPHIYPDAARIIAAEARPPVVLSGDPTPPNSDDEDADDRPGVRLQKKKKGLKRTLSRTQTFTQL
ncbi:hypothetical protein C0991_002885 [Blastosporella zonata]|nr:hypothetical protein C0991_002885 [Blastosporella zonata]